MTELSPDEAAAARAAEQVRLRKARREAKIKAGGLDRMNKITGAGGREPHPAPTPSPPTLDPSPQPTQSASKPIPAHADPPEVDISTAQHFYTPQTTTRIPEPTPDLRQLMLGLDQPSFPGGAGGSPFPGMPPFPGAGPGAGAPGDDPMLNMMMQMLGGGGSGPSPFGPGANPFANFSQQNPMAPQQQQQQQTAQLPDTYHSLWRILHTIVALGLGLYIALCTSFTGTKTERERAALTGGETESARNFFYAFATAEAVLLTTRYFMDRGRMVSPAGGGVLGMIVGFLPPPIKGYIELAMRYGQVFSTVRGDVLVCVFVLGITSWFRA
ncbi:hypothetical protein OQA88_12154 [Cercophora sp. LCS_1]